MIKNILVPLGGSRFSSSALRAAMDIAHAFRGNIRLLHVRDTTKLRQLIIAYKSFGGVSLDMPGITIEEAEIRLLKDEMEKELAAAQAIYDEMKIKMQCPHELIIKEGIISVEILGALRSADIVIMGKALKRDAESCTGLLGSLTEVIQRSNTPILAVCDNPEFGSHVLVAYDGSRSSRNALRVLGEFIPHFVKKVTVLTVRSREDEARPSLDEAGRYFEGYEAEVETIWEKGDPTERILSKAKELAVSAIVMGGYGDNRLKELLIGSITAKVLESVEIPVLLCNG